MDKIEIDSLVYANNRMEEIKEIEAEIANRKQNKMLFQRLPFHKRRRTASFDERRLPREYRRASRLPKRKRKAAARRVGGSFLRTHVWFAKRFSMVSLLDTKLPLKRRQKSDKFIHSALKTRGVLYDESYRSIALVPRRLSEEDLPAQVSHSVDFSRDGTLQNIFLVEQGAIKEKGELCLFEELSIIIADGGDSLIVRELRKHLEVVEPGNRMSIYSLMGNQRVYHETGLFPLPSPSRAAPAASPAGQRDAVGRFLRSRDKPRSAKEEVCALFLPSGQGAPAGKLVCYEETCMRLWERLVVRGIVPCSIAELFRVGTEKEQAVYPFDFLCTPMAREYWAQVRGEEKAAFERTPAGKRPIFVGVDPFSPIYSDRQGVVLSGPRCASGVQLCKFAAPKGSFSPHSPICRSAKDLPSFKLEAGEEAVVGYVVRSAFSFSRGITSGICVLGVPLEGVAGFTYARDVRSDVFRRVRIWPLGSDEIVD